MGHDAGVTITTVAAEAGVSIKTVSRVLNNEAHVRPDTRERVLEVVRALGYRPNAAARSLAGARNYLIGLLYDNPAHGYAIEVQTGALGRCQDLGYGLIPQKLVGGDWAGAVAFRARLSTGGLDGVIVTAPLTERADILETLQGLRVPTVLISGSDTARPGLACVRIDDEAAAGAIARLVLALGHRRIAVIEGPAGHAASTARMAGLRGALSQAGVSLDEASVRRGDFTYRSGMVAAEALLSQAIRPTALIACNDDMAAGALMTAHRLGIGVPRDLSVTGFDDSALASVVWPPLTTVRQPLADMAGVGVDLLLGMQREETGPARRCVVDFEIVVRESTGPVPH
jgi:LacI family transcriptional regulator